MTSYKVQAGSSPIAETRVAIPGTADALLKATHVTKSRYSHQVTYVTLTRLLQEAYDKYKPELPLEKWAASMVDVPTFTFWTLLMKFQAILLTFIQSQRETNFSLYQESLQYLTPLFSSSDHSKYARWVSVHIQDLNELPEKISKAF